MSANIFGERFKIISFGESHGPALGVLIEGCPAGVAYDEALLMRELARRRPGQSDITTGRNEEDKPEILSGIYLGKTLGTPIAVVVRNHDQRSQDYAEVAQQPRPGHGDEAWIQKFGHTDPRGGGRSSGRETLARVIGGAFARMYMQAAHPKTQIFAFTDRVGEFTLTAPEHAGVRAEKIDEYAARFPSARAEEAKAYILKLKENGDSVGGSATVRIQNPPAGLGQPVFHKFKSDLAGAMLSIGATSGVDIGAGAEAAEAQGQAFHAEKSNYGGIQGGITTGEEINVRVHFKPTSSILDVAKKGRHDPFIVTRAVPVLEAMAWLVAADHALWSRTDRL